MKKGGFFRVLSFLLALATGMAFGGCTGPEAAAPSVSVNSGDARADMPEIRLWHHNTMLTAELLENLVETYNALPEAKVRVVVQYLPRNDLLKSYALGVVSGDLPEVAFIDNPDCVSYCARGMFLDITDRMAEMKNADYLPALLSSGQYMGRQYALPVSTNCLALWSNDEMLAAAGVEQVPQTWEEFLACCEMLKKAQPDVWPLAICARKSEEGTFQYLPFLWSAGGDWDSMDSEEAVRSLEFLQSLAVEGYINPEVINWTQGDVERQFAYGQAAMMINGCWQVPQLDADAPALQYTVSLLPRDKTFSAGFGGDNIGMTRSAAGMEDAVWHFVEWLLQDDNIAYFNEGSNSITPKVSVINALKQGDDPVMRLFAQQLEFAVVRGPHPKWPEISQVLQSTIQDVVSGVQQPQQAALMAAEKIDSISALLEGG